MNNNNKQIFLENTHTHIHKYLFAQEHEMDKYQMFRAFIIYSSNIQTPIKYLTLSICALSLNARFRSGLFNKIF